jgi:protein-S-isoprenylcysteine O-methyltransferase Ste14
MNNRFVEWAGKKYSRRQRLLALIPEAIVFLGIIPAILIVVPAYLDRWLDLPGFVFEPYTLIAAIILIISGFLVAFWSVLVQVTIGEGTPAPMMPTQKLIIAGPYHYCRNPMVLGTVILYLGIVVMTGSLSSLGLFVLITSVLLIYVKAIEEKELEARFGEEYLAYKKRTPFLFPERRKYE